VQAIACAVTTYYSEITTWTSDEVALPQISCMMNLVKPRSASILATQVISISLPRQGTEVQQPRTKLMNQKPYIGQEKVVDLSSRKSYLSLIEAKVMHLMSLKYFEIPLFKLGQAERF